MKKFVQYPIKSIQFRKKMEYKSFLKFPLLFFQGGESVRWRAGRGGLYVKENDLSNDDEQY